MRTYISDTFDVKKREKHDAQRLLAFRNLGSDAQFTRFSANQSASFLIMDSVRATGWKTQKRVLTAVGYAS